MEKQIPTYDKDLEVLPELASQSHNGESIEVDKAEQARILRKVDLYLLPIITLLYLMSFLDRSSIGNAKISGLSADLGLKPVQYNIALSIFFMSYVSFECLYFTRDCSEFWRIGRSENLFGSLGSWYPRHALVFRFCLFFSAATLAGAFGGLLARGLVELDGTGGLEGWRWIFIVEGLITVVVAVCAYFWIQDSPESASFLSVADKKVLASILARDMSGESQEFSWPETRAAFGEWKVWTSGIICVGIALPTFSFALFIPTIINGLGYTATRSQLMTVPPYVVAFFFTISVGWLSDRLKVRGIPLLIFTAVGIVGYTIQISVDHQKLNVKYFATFLSAIGIFTTSGLNIPWLSNNLRGHSRRATGSAIQVSIGQLGGVAAAYIYRQQDSPDYVMGHSLALGSLVLAFVTTALQSWWMKKENDALDRKAREEGVDDGFRFTL
ncbi:uncharacterized protein H6S33_005463 [Morchella sextelata]|uniref:uncharacterized protein n=1 Tax=Morchella sextelata TaxID=1174677 RepID=UPI001D046DD2|nr:uncharacterized protein H6S33_005463 [Morchella sextelata]KAH0613577.1 hypothetical protein H6S33_005463 [Morchella sextelata]